MSRRARGARTCVGMRGCEAYLPGHHMHSIHARRIGESPWGWRDGVVTGVEASGVITIEYALESGRLEAWHHQSLIGELERGSPVRVHEGYHALGSRLGWLNLLIHSGVGPVPEPGDVGPWWTEMTAGVVALATGRGVPVDHLRVGRDRP